MKFVNGKCYAIRPSIIETVHSSGISATVSLFALEPVFFKQFCATFPLSE